MDVASAIRLGACLPVAVTNAMSRQRFVGCEHGIAASRSRGSTCSTADVAWVPTGH
jgi:hypothetical protein